MCAAAHIGLVIGPAAAQAVDPPLPITRPAPLLVYAPRPIIGWPRYRVRTAVLFAAGVAARPAGAHMRSNRRGASRGWHSSARVLAGKS